MSLLRSTTVLRLRPALPIATPRVHFLRRAHQDYGSGDGHPAGENPRAQGKQPREDLEHPGPPPPKTSSSSSSSSSPSSAAKGEGKAGKSGDGPQPKILNVDPPQGEDAPEDVKRHNEEVERRAERAHEGVRNEDAGRDKVAKGFWKGHGSAAERHG